MSKVVDLREYKLDKLAVEVFDGCKREEIELRNTTTHQINHYIKQMSDELGMNPCYIGLCIFQTVIKNTAWEAAEGNTGAQDLLNYMSEEAEAALRDFECKRDREDLDRRYWHCDLLYHRYQALKAEHNKRNND